MLKFLTDSRKSYSVVVGRNKCILLRYCTGGTKEMSFHLYIINNKSVKTSLKIEKMIVVNGKSSKYYSLPVVLSKVLAAHT